MALGTITVARRPRPDETYVIVAWETGREGCKLLAEAAIRDTDGATLAVAKGTWILVVREVQLDAAP